MRKVFQSYAYIWAWLGPGKKRDFSGQKPWGHFLKTAISRDFFPEHKNREKGGNFTKPVIYRDQKSKKLPNDRHNERAVVWILIENGAEISDNSALAWHCVTGTFFDGCFKLTRLSFLNKNGDYYDIVITMIGLDP